MCKARKLGFGHGSPRHVGQLCEFAAQGRIHRLQDRFQREPAVGVKEGVARVVEAPVERDKLLVCEGENRQGFAARDVGVCSPWEQMLLEARLKQRRWVRLNWPCVRVSAPMPGAPTVFSKSSAPLT